MEGITPEKIEDIEVDDGVTFIHDHTSRAGKVIKVTKDTIIAKNIVGDKYTVKFERIEKVYKGYYKVKTS